MAAREWFLARDTPAEIDRAVLNRAARLMADSQHNPLSRTELVALRCSYRPGLSANEIVAAAEDALDRN